MKKILVFLPVVALLVALLVAAALPTGAASGYTAWDGKAAKTYAGGSGSQADPYIIKTPAQLKLFATDVNAGNNQNSSFALGADIWYNDTEGWTEWDKTAPKYAWTPAGTSTTRFEGSFDGRGYTIYGLYTAPGTSYCGLVGVARYGNYANITIDRSLFCGNRLLGSVVGQLGVENYFSNCVSYAKIVGHSDAIGGIVGGGASVAISPLSDKAYEESNGAGFRMEDCRFYGEIVSTSVTANAGGIIGQINAGRSRAVIKNCENHGRVTATGANVGGIVGASRQVSGVGYNFLKDCKNYGTVTGGDRVGGIAGLANECSLTGCENYGTVNGKASVGGVVGKVDDPSVTERNLYTACVNAGSVTGTECVGGIAGTLLSTKVASCVNTSPIHGQKTVGGIVGALSGADENKLYSLIDGALNAGSVTGTERVGGICGYAYAAAGKVVSISHTVQAGTSAGAPVTDGNEAFFTRYQTALNVFTGTGDTRDGHAVASLSGGAGFAATGLPASLFTPGVFYPTLTEVDAYKQYVPNDALKITSGDIRTGTLGLRFTAQATYGCLPGADENATYGFLLSREDGKGGVLDIPAERSVAHDASGKTYTAVLTDIPREASFVRVCAVAYVKLGEVTYTSSPLTTAYTPVAYEMLQAGNTDASVKAVASTILIHAPASISIGTDGAPKQITVSAEAVLPVTLSYLTTGSAYSVNRTGQITAKAGVSPCHQSMTVRVLTQLASEAVDIGVDVTCATGSGTVSVNAHAPKDDRLTVRFNEIPRLDHTISKNDGFLFEYNGFVLVEDGGVTYNSIMLDKLLAIRERYIRAAGLGDAEVNSSRYKLDVVWALSHYHSDHYGAMKATLHNSPYLRFTDAYLPVTTANTSVQSKVLGWLRTNNPSVQLHYIDFGHAYTYTFASGKVTVDFLGSAIDWNGYIADCENPNAMWMRVTANGKRFLFTGDTYQNKAYVNGRLTYPGKEMVDTYRNYGGVNYLKCDVFKTMHHGRVSHDAYTFDAVKPAVTVLTCFYGSDSSYVVRDFAPYGVGYVMGDNPNGLDMYVDRDGNMTIDGVVGYYQNANGYAIRNREIE